MGPKGRGGGGGREPELAPKAVWLPLPRSFEVALLGKYHRGHREKTAFGSLLSCREESLTWKYGCVIFFFGGEIPVLLGFRKGATRILGVQTQDIPRNTPPCAETQAMLWLDVHEQMSRCCHNEEPGQLGVFMHQPVGVSLQYLQLPAERQPC